MDIHKRKIYQQKARIFKALSHPIRVWIIEELAQAERCVCWFVEMSGLDFSTISRHLTILKNAHLIEDEKKGKRVFYHLEVPCILSFLSCLESMDQQKIILPSSNFNHSHIHPTTYENL